MTTIKYTPPSKKYEFKINKKYDDTYEEFPHLIKFLTTQKFVASDCWGDIESFFHRNQVDGGSNGSTLKNITLLTEWTGSSTRLTVLVGWGSDCCGDAYIIIEKAEDE